MPKRILLIGAGSSGQRFAKILLAKKYGVDVYQHRPGITIAGCGTISALQELSRYSAAIVSSPTASHLKYARKLLSARIPMLIDKPLADRVTGIKSFWEMANKNKVLVHVGFNLRYVPAIQKITEYVRKQRLGNILYAQIHVGQYLPEWRPHLNYAKTYSAIYEQGGGAALDLIHEVDLAYAWFPKVKLKIGATTKLSALKINVEDYVELESKVPKVRVILEYLSHVRTRHYVIVGDKASITCDLYQQYFIFRTAKGEEEVINTPAFFNALPSYEKELDDFLKLKYHHITERELGIDALRTVLKVRKHVQR